MFYSSYYMFRIKCLSRIFWLQVLPECENYDRNVNSYESFSDLLDKYFQSAYDANRFDHTMITNPL